MSVITFDSVPITVSEINAKVDKLLTLYENIKGFETNPDEVFNIVQAAKYLNLKTARQLEMEAENYLSNRKKAASI